MTEEQYAESYAMNLFNQEEQQRARTDPDSERRIWQELTKKQRNDYRKLADKLLEEIK